MVRGAGLGVLLAAAAVLGCACAAEQDDDAGLVEFQTWLAELGVDQSVDGGLASCISDLDSPSEASQPDNRATPPEWVWRWDALEQCGDEALIRHVTVAGLDALSPCVAERHADIAVELGPVATFDQVTVEAAAQRSAAFVDCGESYVPHAVAIPAEHPAITGQASADRVLGWFEFVGLPTDRLNAACLSSEGDDPDVRFPDAIPTRWPAETQAAVERAIDSCVHPESLTDLVIGIFGNSVQSPNSCYFDGLVEWMRDDPDDLLFTSSEGRLDRFDQLRRQCDVE